MKRISDESLEKLLTFNGKKCKISTHHHTICVFTCGDEAMHSIPNNWAHDEMDNLLRCLNHSPADVSHIASSIISSFEYLLCRDLTEKEAARRLKILRYAYQNKSKRPEVTKGKK